MPAGTVRVTGLRETIRSLDAVNRKAAKVVKDELKTAVEPVAETARQRISRYQGARTSTIGPRVSAKGAFVTQRARKVSGLRGDFGSLQMRHLIGALAEHEADIVDDVDDALGRLIRISGF